MGTLHPVSVLEDVYTTPRPAVRAAGEAFALELHSGVPISMMSTSGATFKDMARAGGREI